MPSVILTNWTVYYADDAGSGGMKQIMWTGTTGTNTINELYSALADLFSIAAQNDADDTIPMRAVTPTKYEIGSFDAGDIEPWFIDEESVKHLSGGALSTVSHSRVQDENTGIVRVSRTGSNILVTDIGLAISHADGDSGTLLDINGNSDLLIRPTDSTSTHNWDSLAGNITCNTHIDVQNGASGTGETLWTNIYTLGTVIADTQMYIVQDNTTITPWWSSGHIDILVEVQHIGESIDFGILTIYARQYSKIYDHYAVDASSGGRNPIPIAMADDLNNNSGYVTLTCNTGSGTFTKWEVIGNNNVRASATALAIITNVAGTTTDPILTIYYIDDLSTFNTSEIVESYTTSAQATIATIDTTVGPTDTGPASITATFIGVSEDLGNDNGSQPYSVTIDCQQQPIATVYERLKYITRRGETGNIATGGQTVIGEHYEGIGDVYIPYDGSSPDDPFDDTTGETITGPGNFTGTLTSTHKRDTNQGFIIVRHISGTVPSDGDTLTGGPSGDTAVVDEDGGADPVEVIAQTKASPFGTFAGGKFFGARGVWLTNYQTGDSQNYELIDSLGEQQVPPVSIPITVSGLQSGDRVSVLPATDQNNTVNRSQYNIQQSHSSGVDSHIRVEEVIPSDTPTSGTIRVVRRDASTNIEDEERYSYTAFSNASQPTYSEFTLSGAITENYDTDDTAYVSYLEEEAAGASVSESVTYVDDRDVTTRVRRYGILPFIINGTINSDGYSTTAIRTLDTIS